MNSRSFKKNLISVWPYSFSVLVAFFVMAPSAFAAQGASHLSQTDIAFANPIAEVSQLAIHADVATAYGIAAAAPASAATTFTFIGDLGNSLASAVAGMPTLADTLARSTWGAEYAVASNFVAATNAISAQYLALVNGAGDLAYTGATNTVGAVVHGATSVPGVPQVAAAFDSLFGTNATNNNDIALASSSPSTVFPVAPAAAPVAISQPVAVTAQSSPPETSNVTPSRTVVSYPTYTTTVVNGVSQAYVNQSLASLRTNILSQVAGMIQPVTTQAATNESSIQQVNMIQSLSGLAVHQGTIDNSTITNSSFTGGGDISAASGSFKTLTISGTATSSFAGNIAFNTNTLYIDSKNGRVGIGTTSPTDTLSVNGPIYLANSSPSSTSNRLYANAGNLYYNGSLVGGGSAGNWLLNGSSAYYNNGNVGIGTTSPYAKLSVAGNVVARSFFATSTTATSTFIGGVNVGPGNGYFLGGAAALSGVPGNSGFIAGFGNKNTSSGSVVGINNTVDSSLSNAFGYSNTASGLISNAFGYNNTASGFISIAFGYNNSSSGTGASSLGVGNLSSAGNSSAVGSSDTASSGNSSAVGFENIASANGASAFGSGNAASGSGSSVFGSGITDGIANSTMIGPSNTAKLTILSTGQTEAPYFTATSTTAMSTFTGGVNVGAGSSYYIGNTAVLMSGPAFFTNNSSATNNNALSIGYGDVASGQDALAIGSGVGINNIASGQNAVSVGDTNYASGQASLAIGSHDTSGYESNAIGYFNTAVNGSSVFGSNITDSIATSTMIGPSNTAKLTILSTGQTEAPYFTATSTTATSTFTGGVNVGTNDGYFIGGVAALSGVPGNSEFIAGFGNKNTASGDAVGIGNTVGNSISNAFGYSNIASGFISNAFGYSNTASAGDSSVFGSNIIDNIANSTMIGPSNTAKLTILSTGNVGIGTTTPASTLTVVGSGCFDVGTGATLACGTAAGNIYYKTANTGNYDVAELYQTFDPSLSAGDVITFDPSHPLAVEKASSPNSSFIGVVSTAPGMVLGGADAHVVASTTVPVALAGRVPVKVSLANGPIAVGDRLTVSSTTPGVAVKLVGSGTYFGQALGAYSQATASGTIIAFIDPGTYYAGLSIAANATPATSSTGTYSLSTLLGQIGASFTNSVLHVVQLAANTFYAAQGFIDHLTAANATIGTASAPTGVTLYDTVTKKPYCFSIANGAPTTTPGVCGTVNVSVNPFGTTAGSATTTGTGTPLTVTVNGSNPTHLVIGGTYVEEGATVTGGVGSVSPYKIYVDGSATATSSPWINTSAPATYILTYSATDSSGTTKTATRAVIVGNPGGTSGSGTNNTANVVTNTPPAATSTATSTTLSVDTPPIVTLIGAAKTSIAVGSVWTDPGATATSTVYGDLTSKIKVTGSVDTAVAAQYTLTYSVTDPAGKTGSATRLVTVVAATSTIQSTASSTASTSTQS